MSGQSRTKGAKKGRRDAGSNERRSASRRLSRLVPPLARRAFRARGFVNEEIVARWPEIVGPELAGCTRPLKLSFGRGERLNAALEVRVAAGYATRLQHEAPRVIDRINAYFGYRAVDRLNLCQGPVDPPPRSPGPVAAPPPDAATLARLDKLSAPVQDEKLRELLRRWGVDILTRNQG